MPTLGFAFNPVIRHGAFLWRDLEELTTRWSHEPFQVSDLEPMKIRIERSSGVHCTIDQQNIVVGFSYPVAVTEDGRQIAFVKVGEKRAFTDLLPLVRETAADVCGVLIKKRLVSRIGVVANVKLPPDAPPPGVEQYLHHLGRPWRSAPEAVVSRVTARLSTTERCHHQVQWQTESTALALNLDWQRLCEPPKEVDAKSLEKLAVEACDSALQYFDKFGEGDLNYGD